ncbi:hypothetical protein VTL71DRAFT_10020 [Oculimacula yallundae]|uniref:Uncharacterized protein n=1 Tax=Oculimacula yallundae TaxID=86028 RepID=A0ABR4BQ86_9HELO
MNTVKSFWVGWGALCVAGGGAYYFAKQSINADRQTRFEAEQRKRRIQESLEYSATSGGKAGANGGPPRSDSSGSPSQEANLDPAPTRHAPDTEGQRVREKSKYEAAEPFRSRKGDRFS